MKRLLFYLFPPKRIEIVLCNRDFAESDGYWSNQCPIGVAFKRKTGVQAKIGLKRVFGERFSYIMEEPFWANDYCTLKSFAESGRPINHKITLIKQ